MCIFCVMSGCVSACTFIRCVFVFVRENMYVYLLCLSVRVSTYVYVLCLCVVCACLCACAACGSLREHEGDQFRVITGFQRLPFQVDSHIEPH